MNSILNSHLFIKRIIALLLFGVFTLAITPKKTLHSLLADHNDTVSNVIDGKGLQLSKAGFNCKCDDLVAESAFIAGNSFVISFPAFLQTIFASYHTSFISLSNLFSDVRGPPVNF